MPTDLLAELCALESALQNARMRGDIALVERLEPRVAELWRQRRAELAAQHERGARDWQRTIRWRETR